MDDSRSAEFERGLDLSNSCAVTRYVPRLEQRPITLDDIVEPVSVGDFIHLDYRQNYLDKRWHPGVHRHQYHDHPDAIV